MCNYLFSSTINLEHSPGAIIISPEARKIKDCLKAEGYCLYVYPDPGNERPEITLEPVFSTVGRIPETVSGKIPNEIKAHTLELAALCVLDEVTSKGHQEAEAYLHVRIEVVSDNEIILRPYTT